GAAAYARLADPEQRSELRIRRRMAREERERETRSAQIRIETDLLDASVQFRKGMALRQAGKMKAAIQELEFAADCDPQNGTYRAEAARARWEHDPTGMGRQALHDLEEAQRVDPSSVEAFLYHGEIAAALGELESAEASLRRAAKLLGPSDRRALDALAALAKQRKKRR
ncbi:MAG TPA: tetratricopeptide repeat protein, partial [Thermoanaerobaculia bacterium]|nr:tetratricopeptide repeat protein [Thermoanaerobaculia bacterium]